MREIVPPARDLPDPDVAEGDLAAMVLQKKRTRRRMRLKRTALAVSRLPFHLPRVLDEDAVEEHRDAAGVDELSVLPDRLVEDDVVRLPLARLVLRIDHRRIFGIDRARLAVRVVVDEPVLAV